MSAITNALGQLEVVRVIDENPTDLKDFGLAAPRLEVEFKADGGKTAGASADRRERRRPAASLYAKRERREAGVAGRRSTRKSALNRSTFDLRDKTLMKFDRATRSTASTSPPAASTIKLAKADTEWKMTKPISGPRRLLSASKACSARSRRRR